MSRLLWIAALNGSKLIPVELPKLPWGSMVRCLPRKLPRLLTN